MSIARPLALIAPIALAVACSGEAPAPTAVQAAAGDRLDLGSASVIKPDGWDFNAPSSTMRLAEAEVPGPDGAALLTVFFFGPGGGGGVEANLQRWIGQVAADPGTEAVRDQFTLDTGFTVTTVEVDGTLQPSGMGGPTEPVPGSTLVGAVVEGNGGPWFFKLTGPQATVDASREVFDAMLRSVKPAG